MNSTHGFPWNLAWNVSLSLMDFLARQKYKMLRISFNLCLSSCQVLSLESFSRGNVMSQVNETKHHKNRLQDFYLLKIAGKGKGKFLVLEEDRPVLLHFFEWVFNVVQLYRKMKLVLPGVAGNSRVLYITDNTLR